MKVLFIYYTGTYNTRYLTDMVEREFIAKGYDTARVEITCDTSPVSTDGYDIIGFSYPIYGFNSPLPFNKYIRKLRFNKGQKFFIYKNSGETLAMNNASSRILLRIMKRQGADFKGEYHFVMPYNIHFPFDRAFVKEILEKDQKLIKIMMHDLENGIVKTVDSNLIYDVGAFFVGIQKIGGSVNSFLYKVDDKRCIRCNLCVKSCPENNIKLKDGKIKFGHRCDMCMRCSFFCPTDAISIGFLQGWKVNGDYQLAKIQNDDTKYPPYITEESKGFYKCFIKTFKEIDEEYSRIFNS